MKTTGAWLLFASALALSACGSAASNNYDLPPPVDPAPLTSMRGRVVWDPMSMTLPDSNRVRVALVWLPVVPVSGRLQDAQDVKRTWGAAGEASIEVAYEPPSGAIGDANMKRYAMGEVILYYDADNDEKLTIAPGFKSPDKVLGRAEGVRVWWLEQGAPAAMDARGREPTSNGWSFTHGPISTAPEPPDCDHESDPGAPLHPRCNLHPKAPAVDVSPKQVFDISASTDSKLQAYACAGYWGASSENSDEWPDDTPGWGRSDLRAKISANWNCKADECPPDVPVHLEDAKYEFVACSPDKLLYTWKSCVLDESLCGTKFCHYGARTRTADELPNDWPQDCRPSGSAL